MRVAMVSEHASPLAALGGVDAGGQNVHVAALASALARRGAEVTVFTRRDDRTAPRRVHLGGGVSVVHVDAGPAETLPKDHLLPHMDAFAEELEDEWQRDPPDVVHAHFWMSGLASVPPATALGIPVVQTFHALGAVKRRHLGADDPSPARRLALERGLMHSVNRIAATCSDEVFELLRQGTDRARVSIIPCGVDHRAFRPQGPTEPRARPRVVCASRLVPRKGIDDAIRAIAELPGVDLVVAGGPPRERLGDDPEAARLLSLADELGVADRVDLRGGISRTEVAALLRSADLVACTPWYEPFGIVPLEAMACGVPVVATAVGGLVDTVVPEVTGRLVPVRRPDLLARSIALMLTDPEALRRMGAAGLERVRARYTWERIAADTEALYARVLGGRRAGAMAG